jgi:hypothetical protein
MKKITLAYIIVVLAFAANAQGTMEFNIPIYKFYFIKIASQGKGSVIVIPEDNVFYPDIDTLIVDRKGTKAVGKEYHSYTEIFNALSKKYLEFVQFMNTNNGWGAETNVMIWRKRIQ